MPVVGGDSSTHKGHCLSVWNFMRFLQVCFCSLLRSLWLAAHSSAVSTAPPNAVLAANRLGVRSVPSSRSLMKVLDSISPSLNLWALPAVTDIQLDFAACHNPLNWPIQQVFYLHPCLSWLCFIRLSVRVLSEMARRALLKWRQAASPVFPSSTMPVLSSR